MASIITSISLDLETVEIKDRVIANYGFSRWIRECLREADAQANPAHTTEEEHRIGGLCNGMKKPACVICWPEGAPTSAGWKEWISIDHTSPVKRRRPSAEKPRIIKAGLADSDARTERQKTTPRRRAKVGLIRRFIRWIY